MMDAKELLAAMDGATVNILQSPEANALVRSALSLLAAAEANDGTTPETGAARLTINQRRMIAEGRGVVSEMVEASVASRLERERNGLAAEVLRLKVLLRNNIPWARIDA